MFLSVQMSEIVSVSELTKDFKRVCGRVKKTGKCVVFRNNKPEFVLLSLKAYEELTAEAEVLKGRLLACDFEANNRD